MADKDDNAWGEVSRAEKEYSVDIPNFFRNVRDCDNNSEQMQQKKEYSAADIGKMGPCFFPVAYVKADKPGSWRAADQGYTDVLSSLFVEWPMREDEVVVMVGAS